MRSGSATAHRRCLCMVPEPQRSFRLHVSRLFGLRSLSDFMRNGNAWLTQREFAEHHVDFTLASVSTGQQLKWLRSLYREATQIVQRLNAPSVVRLLSGRSTRLLLPHLGVQSTTTTFLFPIIPRSSLLAVVWVPTPPRKLRPLKTQSSRFSDAHIKEHVRLGKRLHKVLLPILHDLQWRLAFRLLPVRSQFWFFETVYPRVQCCVRDGCDAIETEAHLSYECTLAA